MRNIDIDLELPARKPSVTSSEYTAYWALGTVSVIALLVLAYHVIVKPEAQASPLNPVVQATSVPATPPCYWAAIRTQINLGTAEVMKQSVDLFPTQDLAAIWLCAIRANVVYEFEADAAAVYCKEKKHHSEYLPPPGDDKRIVTLPAPTSGATFAVIEACGLRPKN